MRKEEERRVAAQRRARRSAVAKGIVIAMAALAVALFALLTLRT